MGLLNVLLFLGAVVAVVGGTAWLFRHQNQVQAAKDAERIRRAGRL